MRKILRNRYSLTSESPIRNDREWDIRGRSGEPLPAAFSPDDEFLMWCKQCRQDVPGIASLAEGAFHCARCGGCVGRRRTSPSECAWSDAVCDQGIDLTGEDHKDLSPTGLLDQWAEDEHLENVRRLLRPLSACSLLTDATRKETDTRLRFDPPASHALRISLPELTAMTSIPAYTHTSADDSALQSNYAPPARAWRSEHQASDSPAEGASLTELSLTGLSLATARQAKPTGGLFASFASCVASTGLMGLVCGGVLMGWSLAAQRSELWTIGLPIALVGNFILFVGILLAFWAKNAARRKAVREALRSSAARDSRLETSPAPAPAMLAELRGQWERLSPQFSASGTSAQRAW